MRLEWGVWMQVGTSARMLSTALDTYLAVRRTCHPENERLTRQPQPAAASSMHCGGA